MSVSGRQGENAVLWMTRRIAERLGPALINEVKALPDEALVQQADQPQQANQAAQVYEQLQARLMLKQWEPVRVAEQAPELLVNKINLTKTAEGIVAMRFVCNQGEQWVQVMTQTELRQWLQMLQGLFARASWRTDIWPSWLQKGKAEPNR